MQLEMIEGIGPKFAQTLRGAGVKNTDKLLEMGSTRKGRDALCRQTGISDALILRWINRADLCRISGVSTQYSELLEAAGVDTVKELRNRRADNLTAKMREVNAEKRLVRRPPAESEVAKWVEQAKVLPPIVSY